MNYQPQTNTELQEAVNLWCENKNEGLNKYGHISLWDTSKITNMHDLFAYKRKFNDDISDWDISNVTNMDFMFQFCHSFNQPIHKWNVTNVTSMFQDLSGWNIFNENSSYSSCSTNIYGTITGPIKKRDPRYFFNNTPKMMNHKLPNYYHHH
jgi:surface protein